MPLRIWSCDEWKAREVSARFKIAPALGIVIHHTAGANRKPQTGQAEVQASFQVAREIQNYHMRHNGWADSGHHWLVSRGGVVLEGRHTTLEAARHGQVVRGAHASDGTANRHWWGIENEGRYDKALDMPEAQWNALVALCRQLREWGKLDPNAIQPHKHFKATACPGLLEGRIPELRRLIGEEAGPAILINGVRTKLTATLDAEDHTWVPIRPVYEALPAAWKTTHKFQPIAHEAELITLVEGRDDRYRVPLDIRGGDGWVKTRTLPRWGVLAVWDSARRELNLTTQ